MIVLIGTTAHALSAPLVQEVLGRWPASGRPPLEALTAGQLLDDDQVLDGAAAAWVVAGHEQDRHLAAALDLLSERRVPAMVTRPGDTEPAGTLFQEGVVLAPPSAGPVTLLAVLQTLWAQANVVRAVQREVRLLQAQHGGLCTQIDKIDEELRLAAQLQREFLPHELPRVGQVEVKVLFRPATYVSGDIYDVVRLDEDHLGLFVADAVGHGVPAALMTMYIKRALATKSIDSTAARGYRITPPDEALARLNQDMAQQQSSGKVRFATACYAVVNCRTLAMTFARAGHPFPMVLHADGSSELLSPDGGMLGIFPNEVYERASVQLRPGDRLLLYSDGFELAFPRPEGERRTTGRSPLAHERYCEEFKQLARGTLDEAMERLAATLDRQAGSLNQQDDMTVVCLGVAGREAQFEPGAEPMDEAVSPLAA